MKSYSMEESTTKQMYFDNAPIKPMKADSAVFAKDYVLEDPFETKNSIDEINADNFTKRIGIGSDTIKIIKNFMREEEADILKEYCKMLYKETFVDQTLKMLSNKIIDSYKEKIKIKAQELFGVELERDDEANKNHIDTNYLNGRPPAFATPVHTDFFGPPNNYEWSGHLSNLIYINDDYLGGEIYFPHHNLKIKPEKGMLISFPGNYFNRHGIIPSSDYRYAMSVFFKIKNFN